MALALEAQPWPRLQTALLLTPTWSRQRLENLCVQRPLLARNLPPPACLKRMHFQREVLHAFLLIVVRTGPRGRQRTSLRLLTVCATSVCLYSTAPA